MTRAPSLPTRLWLCLLPALLAGCDDDEPPPATPSEASASPREDAPEFRTVAGGVSWTAEEPLVAQRPANEMRDAQYAVRDHPEAVLTVAHFPPQVGGGGGVQENLDRWTGQFREASEPAVARREVNDLPVTTIRLAGTFVGRRGMAAGRPTPRPGYVLHGAIVEGEQGLVFFKLLGPEEAVGLAEDAFERLVASIHPV